MIKRPIYAFIALALLVVVLGFVVNRLMFLRTAQRTMGTVTQITSYNTSCGGRRTRHACTQFSAHVRYNVDARDFNLKISAGSARGHDQPLSSASFRPGDPVRVVYDPNNPATAYQDTLFGIWGTPLMIAFAQISTFITSLTEGRSRTRRYA